MHVLITGFGPFPGAPSNPTQRLARHVVHAPLPGHGHLERTLLLLPTTWAMLDELPERVARLNPDAILMFGLAGRRRKVTPEGHLVNRRSILRPDASGRRAGDGTMVTAHCVQHGLPARQPGVSVARLTALLRRAGIPAAPSRDAGDYLCNALAYQMAGAPVPALFIHVPRPRRSTRPTPDKGAAGPRSGGSRPSMRTLERAGRLALRWIIQQRLHRRGVTDESG